MASQLVSTTGSRRRRPTYVDQINEQRNYLPQIIKNKADMAALAAQQELQEKQYGLSERELGLNEQSLALKQKEIAETARSNAARKRYEYGTLQNQQRQLDYQKDASARTAGLEMLKLGTNLTMNNKIPGATKTLSNPSSTTGSKVGAIAAPGLVGGLAGWGAGKAFGGGNTFKKALFGTGAGLLTSFLGGNWGDWGSMTSGGLGGLLGGLFS